MRPYLWPLRVAPTEEVGLDTLQHLMEDSLQGSAPKVSGTQSSQSHTSGQKPLVLYWVLNRGPIILGIQNQGVLNQIPTSGC